MIFKKDTLYFAFGLFVLAGIALITNLFVAPEKTAIKTIPTPVERATLVAQKGSSIKGTLLTINASMVENCQNSISLDEQALLFLPQQTFTTHHTWSKTADSFSGPLLLDVLNLACKNVGKLKLTALNDYAIEMDFPKIRPYQPIVALSVNGKRLPIRDKGPLWVMIPLDQYSELPDRSMDDMLIWQLSDISILASYEAS